MLKTTQKNRIIAGALIILNLFLVYISGMDKGRMSFYSIPAIFLLNFGFLAFSLVKKNKKLIITVSIVLLIAPILAIIRFLSVFQFLTR
jgi:hypothetical protein